MAKSSTASKRPSRSKIKIEANHKTKRSKSHNVFTLPWVKKDKKNFSSTFEYGDFVLNIKGRGKVITITFSLQGKSFNLNGDFTLNEKSYDELQNTFSKIISNLRNA